MSGTKIVPNLPKAELLKKKARSHNLWGGTVWAPLIVLVVLLLQETHHLFLLPLKKRKKIGWIIAAEFFNERYKMTLKERQEKIMVHGMAIVVEFHSTVEKIQYHFYTTAY